MSITNYLEKVNEHYRSGRATEHTYRGDFAELIKGLVPNIHITNEPSNVTDCGNPDYVITQQNIPIGFIEAKDLGKNLDSNIYKEQFGRYRKALDNLIITDYLRFQFYQNGEKVHEICIAEIDGEKIKPLPENFEQFINLINDFCTFIAQTIKSPRILAEMMAAKARLLENILERSITSDEERSENTALKQQYETFKSILIHDLTPQAFADIYAQTLAYGMFAARLHDKTLDTFSRQEASELIPKSNPFLRKLFNHVAGVDIDERIVTTVDNLADVFRATNVDELLKNFGKATQTQDPIIHFYETFLAEYDPKLRKARGVWYTPEPVVKFIVRGVDEILRTEFGLKDGLSDISKTTVKVQTDQRDRRTKSGYVEIDKEVHKVQVLDPATGTGTFLAEVVKFIYGKKFKAMQGAWSGYIEEHLIPRLNGFELLMASYSMAHLKLDMLLTDTGYKSKKSPRFNIFLTNSLEEHHPDTGTLFSSWLSTEANEANNVKRDSPVMVVLGNPPYSVSSSNKGVWIQDLLNDYKKDLNERNIQPLSDDYIKFIRYSQYLVEKNGEGILAFITNNSFIDGRIHRKMRESLLGAFDQIYILDLHGSLKKIEKTEAGGKDENVFDIQQGVSITFLVKKPKASKVNNIFHYDILGSRKDKYSFLNNESLKSIQWNEIKCQKPYYFFVPKDFSQSRNYSSGFKIIDLFHHSACGSVTARDKLLVKIRKSEVNSLIDDFNEMEESVFREKYNEYKDSRDWKYLSAKNDIQKSFPKAQSYYYRPFDIRYLPYTSNSRGILSYPRNEIMKHMLRDDNFALLVCKQQSTFDFQHVLVTKTLSDKCTLSSQTKEASYHFPLYVYHGDESNDSRSPNLKIELIKEFEVKLGLKFSNEPTTSLEMFSPVDLLDYIYAILYSPSYRSKYKEFLKIDFPKIPYPQGIDTFLKLVGLGKQLRNLHLLEADGLENHISCYPESGNNKITTKIRAKDWEVYDKEKELGRIWINERQFFEGIPLKVWEFYIGGYQPAQKWLKDRSGKILSFNDILHYQKIIIALNKTDEIMLEINKIELD